MIKREGTLKPSKRKDLRKKSKHIIQKKETKKRKYTMLKKKRENQTKSIKKQ